MSCIKMVPSKSEKMAIGRPAVGLPLLSNVNGDKAVIVCVCVCVCVCYRRIAKVIASIGISSIKRTVVFRMRLSVTLRRCV